MKVDLSGRVALVTGAGRHIGRAIADAFVTNGAIVIYSDIDEDAARVAAQHRPAIAFAQTEAVRLDVTDEVAVNAVISGVVKRHGRLDVVVNNAGINTSAHRVTVDRFPKVEWDRILDVDLTGLYLVSKAAAGVMIDQGCGKIINIGSVMGLVPARLQCAYTAAKAGVVNLTRAMAIELGGRGVLVNCVAPGSILTEGTKQLFYDDRGQFNDKMERLLAHIPLGRPGSCEEIAHAVLSLLRQEAATSPGRRSWLMAGGWLATFAISDEHRWTRIFLETPMAKITAFRSYSDGKPVTISRPAVPPSPMIVNVQDGVPVAYPGCYGVGVRVVHPVNPQAPSKNLGLVLFYIPPHVLLEPGQHETEETYVILKGAGTMKFHDEKRDVREGDFVYLPPWCLHGIENTGRETMVVLICTAPPNP